MLNVITNYYSDIPNNFFIYNGYFNLWPSPSTGSTALTYTALTGSLNAGDTVTVGSASGKILTFTSTVMQVAVTSQTAFGTGSFTTSGSASGTVTAFAVTPGNTITFNYKIRVHDLTFADYSTGTIASTNNNLTLTGTSTHWLSNYLVTAGSALNLNSFGFVLLLQMETITGIKSALSNQTLR